MTSHEQLHRPYRAQPAALTQPDNRLRRRMVYLLRERRRLRAALHARDQDIQRLRELAPLVLYRAAADDGRTLGRVSPAFETLIGYPAADFTGAGRPFATLIHHADRDRVRAAIQNCSPAAPDYDLEYRLVRADGMMRWVRDRGVVLFDATAHRTGLDGALCDITREKEADRTRETLSRANRELTQVRQQAEAVARHKAEFVATLSHEMRTPLNVILGYTELLLGDDSTQTDQRHHHHERIFVSARHLLHLVNEVLDLSKIDAGRMEIVNQPFDLHHFVDEIISQNRILAEDKGLVLHTVIDPALPPVIIGDVVRTRQIVINLLSNAIKFTPNGSVTLTLRRPSDTVWQLSVRDTGLGIPAHLHATIFQEFQQVAEHQAGQPAGSGLGLAIVDKLVRLLGGTIRLTSEVGLGSEFVVELPLQPDETPSDRRGGHAAAYH